MTDAEVETLSESQEIHRFHDAVNDIRGAIVIDSTARGPALGGCRVWNYPSFDAAIWDGRRLARGMSYKNAFADLPFGGGKAVVCTPAGSFDREALFNCFAGAVEALGGRYITGEDVGTSVADMEIVRSGTRHVFGLSPTGGKVGGDPSPWTALGVFASMQAIARRERRELSRMTVAIQGAGHVGRCLAELVADAGAGIVIADIDRARAGQVAQDVGGTSVAPAAIYDCAADIFAPCALGGALNAETIPRLRSWAVVGAANNQLARDEDGAALLERGIIYAPDYVVNSGGVINMTAEHLGHSRDWVRNRVNAVSERLLEVLEACRRDGVTPAQAADKIARGLIAAAA